MSILSWLFSQEFGDKAQEEYQKYEQSVATHGLTEVERQHHFWHATSGEVKAYNEGKPSLFGTKGGKAP